MRFVKATILAVAVALSACSTKVPGVSCDTTADCSGKATCQSGVCVSASCEPACSAVQDCVESACQPAFSALALTAPLDGATVKPPFAATATLTRRDGSAAALPATVTLKAKPATGEVEEAPLALAGDHYEGQVSLKGNGAYTMWAELADGSLKSPEAKVAVVNCGTACPANQECLSNGCGPSFTGLTFNTPAANATVGPSVQVKVTVNRAEGALAMPPATISLTATPSAGTAEGPISLARNAGTDTYSGTWMPAKDGAYSITASADAATGIKAESLNVTVDKTGPVFVVTVEAPPARTAVANLIQEDPNLAGSYRRDETAVVKITSVDADVDEMSVGVTVNGVTGGAKSLGAPSRMASCVAAQKYCRKIDVELWDPVLKMDAFSGKMKVTVTGKDKLGNVSANAASDDVKVTRWKWAFKTSGAIKTSPALGAKGLVYFGDAGVSGTAYAVAPDGSKKFEFPTSGSITASMTVASASSGERVFVAGKAGAAAAVWALDSNPTGALPVCSNGTSSQASLGLMKIKLSGDSSELATAVGVFNAGAAAQVIAVRPDSMLNKCVTFATQPADSSTGVAIGGKSAFVGDNAGNIQGFDLDSSNAAWSKRQGFPVLVGNGNAPTNPLIDGSTIAGAGGGVGVGTLFLLPLGGGQSNIKNLATGSPTSNAVESRAQELIAGSNDGKLHFVPIALAAERTSVTLDGPIKSAPAIGSDQAIYVATQNSSVYALDKDGKDLWKAPLGDASESSPALDCSRKADGSVDLTKPGVLYVGSDDGKLYAFIVESKGLDTQAPWPKFHRDPANTGNADFDLKSMVCQ